jgi:nitrite reductase (NO-forming)
MTTTWLVVAVVVAAITVVSRSALPQPLWTAIHVVTLGVLTNAILQWSWYFAKALLHLPVHDHRAGRDAVRRSLAFNLALVGLVAAMWTAWVWGTIVFAGLVGAVIGWHGLALLRAARGRFASRFAVVIRYYVAAAAFLVIGCVLAGFLTVAMFAHNAPDWLLDARDNLTLAHAIVNLAGWVGLSIAGTVVTLWPTMLRTKIDPNAVPTSLAAMPVLAGGVAVAGLSASLGWLPGVGLGLAAFAVALAGGVAAPLVRTALRAAVRGYASWTMASGLGWAVLCLLVIGFQAVGADDAAALRNADLPWLVLLGGGGVGQIFIGALSYLMPVVIGGGPDIVRRGIAPLETAATTRLAVRNAAILLLAVTVTPADAATGSVRPLLWGLVIACFAVDVVMFARSGMTQGRARRALAETRPQAPGLSVSTTFPVSHGGATGRPAVPGLAVPDRRTASDRPTATPSNGATSD